MWKRQAHKILLFVRIFVKTFYLLVAVSLGRQTGHGVTADKQSIYRLGTEDSMKILNYGSLNLDRVYDVPHFAAAQETILCSGYGEFLGGKGLNQSVALARAGSVVFHLGAVGHDGASFFNRLQEEGVDVRFLTQLDTVSGHAVIQNTEGQNCIIVCNGANGMVTRERIREAIGRFEAGDVLLLQNEVANVAYSMERAEEQGMKVVFNASPITPEISDYPLELVDVFVVNEVEARALAETEETEYEAVLRKMAERFPEAAIVMTVGADGVLYRDARESLRCGAYRVPVVDTTAAGDTFCGYFIAGLAEGLPVRDNLERAGMASALAIGKKGASNSIPGRREVEDFRVAWPQEAAD